MLRARAFFGCEEEEETEIRLQQLIIVIIITILISFKLTGVYKNRHININTAYCITLCCVVMIGFDRDFLNPFVFAALVF